MRRFALPALTLFMLIALVGCKAQPAGPTGSGLIIEPLDAQRLGYSIAWATDLEVPAHSRMTQVAVLDDVIVTVETPANLVTAVSAHDGSLLWRQVVGGKLDRLFKPGRYQDQVLVNSETQLFRLDAQTGRIAQIEQLQGVVSEAPAMVDRFTVFGGGTGTVFAHDLATGYTRWAYQLTGNIRVPPQPSQLNVFVADGNGVYAMFAGSDGELQWRGRTFGPVSVPPVVSAQNIYLACEDQSLYAIYRSTGRDRWVYRTTQPLKSKIYALGDYVFLPLPGKDTVVLAATDGAEKWRYPSDMAEPITLEGDRLLINDHSELVLLEAATGKPINRAPVTTLRTIMPIGNAGLLLVTPQGRLLRLDRR